MKNKYNNIFTESKIAKIDDKITELYKEAVIELGFGNTEEEIDLS